MVLIEIHEKTIAKLLKIKHSDESLDDVIEWLLREADNI
jgi:predicted CopG family antitoxin